MNFKRLGSFFVESYNGSGRFGQGHQQRAAKAELTGMLAV